MNSMKQKPVNKINSIEESIALAMNTLTTNVMTVVEASEGDDRTRRYVQAIFDKYLSMANAGKVTKKIESKLIDAINEPMDKYSVRDALSPTLELACYYCAMATAFDQGGDISTATHYAIRAGEATGMVYQVVKNHHLQKVFNLDLTVKAYEFSGAKQKKQVSEKASANAKKRHEDSDAQQVKNAIKNHWLEWQELIKTNPKSARCFINKTAFAYQMLHNFPALKGSKKQNPEVILRWVRVWEKE